MKLVTIPYVVDQIIGVTGRSQSEYTRIARTLRLAIDDIGLQFQLPLRTTRLTLSASLDAPLPDEAMDVTKVGLVTAGGGVVRANLVGNNIDFRAVKQEGCTCPEGYSATTSSGSANPTPANGEYCPSCYFFNYQTSTPIYGYTRPDTRVRATVDLALGKIIFDATQGIESGRSIIVEYTSQDRNDAGDFVVRQDAVLMLLSKTCQLLSISDNPQLAGIYEAQYYQAKRRYLSRTSRSNSVSDILAALRGSYSAAVPNI